MCWQNPLRLTNFSRSKRSGALLAQLTDIPNTPDEDGETPIHMAAQHGHTENVKIIESFQTSKKRNAGASSAKPNKKRAKKF